MGWLPYVKFADWTRYNGYKVNVTGCRGVSSSHLRTRLWGVARRTAYIRWRTEGRRMAMLVAAFQHHFTL